MLEDSPIQPTRDQLRRLAKEGAAVLVRQSFGREEYRVGRTIYECISRPYGDRSPVEGTPVNLRSTWYTLPPRDGPQPFKHGIAMIGNQTPRILIRQLLVVVVAAIVAWAFWKIFS